ncbi:hypothetical protein A2960_04470 [Candidatus Gottesmanbacteria bacterium RIFCSPLOWO2_01_FULL_39_12b]|uniref:N-acetyltransferase domain-containing protein n=1 Tax=Candidatus Gottesmanbacteria bacterium RIFCSPLOWO2_01_FULL_39_12b TaxID=1798388 RepID=A0A1F6AND8_9BACT|nr:MAG: hypothetical protein A2960_04470 [Candidatus Gottesmanbacteria bacterium RIFCSPLOWO2_01_FULL_39_12b]
MTGKIVYKGKSKKGNEIIIRYPEKSDLNELWRYINKLSKEKTFVRFQGEEITLKEEEKFVKDTLKKIREKKTIQLLVFHRDHLIGISGIEMYDKVVKHLGLFGISVENEYRSEGIGRQLMRCVIEEAKKHLPDLRIITLSHFAVNSVARKMYDDFGFKEYGKLPKGLFYRENYIDYIFMYKNIS